jgi:hypothetical protein
VTDLTYLLILGDIAAPHSELGSQILSTSASTLRIPASAAPPSPSTSAGPCGRSRPSSAGRHPHQPHPGRTPPAPPRQDSLTLATARTPSRRSPTPADSCPSIPSTRSSRAATEPPRPNTENSRFSGDRSGRHRHGPGRLMRAAQCSADRHRRPAQGVRCGWPPPLAGRASARSLGRVEVSGLTLCLRPAIGSRALGCGRDKSVHKAQ